MPKYPPQRPLDKDLTQMKETKHLKIWTLILDGQLAGRAMWLTTPYSTTFQLNCWSGKLRRTIKGMVKTYKGMFPRLPDAIKDAFWREGLQTQVLSQPGVPSDLEECKMELQSWGYEIWEIL